MRTTYQQYTQSLNYLPFETFNAVHEAIIDHSTRHDPTFNELWEDVIVNALSYTQCRVEYGLASPEKRGERNLGQTRTIKHNAFMLSLTVLSRYMKTIGWETDWADTLGLSDADSNRKTIGDFANYLTLIQALSAR